MIFEFILLQAEGGGAEGASGMPGWSNWALIGGIILIFYFFMIRPQAKKQKEEKEFREGLKKGDKVITIGGIHGRIVSVEEHACLVEVDSGVKIKFEKAALRGAEPEGEKQDK